ncbi:hypothetical protein CHS0354_007465, partial [Potamilus streckersoni]
MIGTGERLRPPNATSSLPQRDKNQDVQSHTYKFNNNYYIPPQGRKPIRNKGKYKANEK